MGAVGDFVGGIGDVVGGVTDTLFGGKQSPIQGSNYEKMSPAEAKRLQDLEGQINDLFGPQNDARVGAMAQNKDIQNLFANNLKTFLLKGGQNTPEDVNRASQFVDQTFTNPTQNVVNQNIADYQSQAQAKAAALGRDPNIDIATQQAIAGEGLRQNIGLQAERGNRIQQAVKDNYNQTLGSLNAGMQGSGYLNSLAQQAFSNQLNLLNGKTGLADFYQKERGKTTTNNVSTTPGIFGQINNGLGQIAQTGQNIGKIGAMFGG